MKKHGVRLAAGVLALALLLMVTTVSLGDAGSFSGDSDWGGGSDWGSSDWGSSDWGSSDWDSSDSGSNWGSGFGSGWLAGSLMDGDDGSSSGGYSHDSFDDSGSTTSYDGKESIGCLGMDITTVVFLLIVAFIVYRFIKSKKKNAGAEVYQAAQEDPGLPLEQLKEKDPNFNEQQLLEKVGNQYVQMQQAWESKKWEPMRAIMTDSLYNQMARQLEALSAKGLTNRVEKIAVLDSRIVRYAVEGDNDVLTIRLQTRICDYTVNDKTGEVVGGNQTKELFMTYDWKLIRQKDKKTLEQATMTEINCPNCGAPLSINQSGKCPYCDAVITLSDHDWALSVIKGISQRSA